MVGGEEGDRRKYNYKTRQNEYEPINRSCIERDHLS